ncbi:MAG: HEAT repeat domain-containing protein [Phycisphaerae bacterium]|nr:HEAT repeat domain-containing protein [Phycisphaerae bacterium]
MSTMRITIAATIAAMLATTAIGATPKPVKIYIIAGQSNAEERMGVGFLAENFPEYSKLREDIWRMRPGVNSPTPFMGPKYGSYGVEHAAGYILADAVDNDILFIRSAVGGTMLHTRWRSPSAVKRLGGPVGDLYDRMIKRVHNTVANLGEFLPTYRGQGYELAGVIWFQGENDCCAKTQGFYRDGLMDLIADTRREMGVANLPFAIVKINDGCWGPPAVDVWAAEEYAAHADKNVVAVNTRDLRGLCHYDGESYITIGQRLGKALLPLAKKPVHVGDEKIRAAAKAYFARVTTPGSPQDMTSLKKGLVGYWKFDEGQSTVTASALPGGARGALYDRRVGAAQWVRGKFGKAIKLTRTQSATFSEYKDPVNKAGRIEQFSVAFWARTPGGRSSYRIGRGAGKPYETRNPGNWYISPHGNLQGWDVVGFDNGHSVITAAVADANDGKKPVTFSALAREGFGGDGVEWRHQAYVFDAKAKEVRFYTNGKLVQTAKTTMPEPTKRNPTPTGVDVAEIIPAGATTPLKIGGIELHDMDFDFCAYDELAIWSRPLSDADVKKLYNGGDGSEIIVGDPLSAKSLAQLRKIFENEVDSNVRYKAVRAAAGRGEASVDLLVDALKDKSAGVRYGAAQGLGEMGRPMQARALAMLKGDDRDMQVLATVMLKHMGRKASPAETVPALVAVMNDEFFDVRMGAVDALGVLGNWAEAAVPALLTATTDREWWVRDSAHFALTAIQTPQSRAGMIEALDRDRHSVTWFQAAGKLLAPIKADPALQKRLALSYASWLCKGKGWTAPFAARGKFGCGLRGLQEFVKNKQPLPAEVGKTIKRILDGKEEPLWSLKDRGNRKALEDILATMNKSEGAK